MIDTNVTYDYVIIGAGIIGLTIAYELISRNAHFRIMILEKESDVGLHASGKNSGILHAGFYYTADSLKAKFCREGNAQMKAFCRANKIKVLQSEKLVVARDETELETLNMLYKRGLNNGVKLELIDDHQAEALCPAVKTYRKALYSPTTASVDPKQVCLKLKTILLKFGVNFKFDTKVKKITPDAVITSKGKVLCSYLINAAGLYADTLAKQLGLAKKYTILPFKGLYLKHTGDKPVLNMNLYPVPNLNNPFLGVHYTIVANGDVKVGPTAIPAFWRENYSGFSRFNLQEFLKVCYYQAKLFYKNSFNFRQLAISELKKYRKKRLINDAAYMIKSLDHRFTKIPAGIRAQLLNTSTNELEMDFIVEYAANSAHILNAVSPAFTCSFAFSRYIVDSIFEKQDRISV